MDRRSKDGEHMRIPKRWTMRVANVNTSELFRPPRLVVLRISEVGGRSIKREAGMRCGASGPFLERRTIAAKTISTSNKVFLNGI